MADHLHDLDLIAAYADGVADDASEARRLLDTCPLCREEYQAQRHIKQLFASLPAPVMTETERQHLHRALVQPGGGRVMTFAERRRARRWMQLGTVAAGLVLVVGLGSVFLRMMGGAQSDGAEEEAVAAATTAAAAETFTTAAGAMAPLSGEAGGLARLAGGDEEAVRAEVESLLETNPQAGFAEDATAPEPLPCAEQLDGETVLAGAESTLNGRPILIYVVEDSPVRRAVIYYADTCTAVDLR